MSRNRWLWGCALLLIGTIGAVALAFFVVNIAMSGDEFALSSLKGRVGLVEVVG